MALSHLMKLYRTHANRRARRRAEALARRSRKRASGSFRGLETLERTLEPGACRVSFPRHRRRIPVIPAVAKSDGAAER